MRARVMIPKVRDADRDRLLVTAVRHDPLSDAYRTVRNLVAFTQGAVEPEGRAHVTLIVSPSPGDGKTSLAVNLAAAMAESGRRTLLLNGDFRRPRIVSALGPDAQAPLPFMLEDVQQIGVRAMLTRSGSGDPGVRGSTPRRRRSPARRRHRGAPGPDGSGGRRGRAR